MSEEIKLPALGDGIEGGDVVNVLVTEGTAIEKEGILLELETEKAVVEVPSPKAGTIEKVHVKKGDTVKVGQTLVSLTGAADAAPPPAKTPKEKPPASAKSAKEIQPQPAKTAAPAAPAPVVQPPAATGRDLAAIPAGPASRKLARELGLDIGQVPGSGRGGRITEEDVKAYAKRRLQSGAAGRPSLPPLPDFSQWGETERQAIPSLRRKISDNLGAAWPAVPLVTQFDEADITPLEEMRKKNIDKVKAKGGRLTFTVFALKAVVYALREHPQFNASFDIERGELVFKKYFNIGVAVDTPQGLIVPVIRNVDEKHFLDLAVELTQLSERARERKVSLDELRGGNISISNLGGIGGTAFTPLVLPPDVAVVGLARSQMRPVWKDGQFQPRLILPFCVSYDHRVIDGADGARFCRSIVHALENHEELLITG